MAGVVRARFLDWSAYQKFTDLKAVVAEWNIVGLIARCTIGWAYVDPFYEHNFRQAQELDILFGAYHVLWPWNKDPLREVRHFRDHIKVDGRLPDFVVDDLELPKPSDAAGWKKVTPRSVGQQIVAQLPAMAAATGLATLCYTRSTYWNDPAHLGLVTPLGVEGEYSLIEAEYPVQQPCGKLDWGLAPEAPKMPVVSGGWKPEDVVMWQWTSCLKPLGVQNASQDADVLIPTYEQFLVMISKAVPPMADAMKLERLWNLHPELHYA